MSPYTAGDTVKLSVEFDHKAGIEWVWASYEPVSGEGTALDLYATRDAIALRESGDHTTNIFSATLSGEVTVSHDPGTYRCTELRAQTVGGKRLEFSQLPTGTLDIESHPSGQVQEPSGLVQLREARIVE
jgi:hypothetical protein